MKKILLLTSMFFCLLSNAQFLEPGFEGGAVATAWTQFSTNFGTPLCDAVCGDCGGGCAPQNGAWYAWFGGANPGTEEIGALSQTLNIPTGTAAFLTFYVKVGNAGDSSQAETLDVLMDANILFSIDASMAEFYDNYLPIFIDISAYANGANHDLSIGGFSMQGSSILIDSFSLIVDGQQLDVQNEMLNREMPISFYPNPANAEFTMRFNNNMVGTAVVRVFDMSSKLVSAETLTQIYNGTYVMNTTSFENGVYSVVVENNGQIITSRFVVAH